MESLKSAEIRDGIYWVGGNGQNGGLHCNPYLIIDGDEAVLIDPGSVLDFEYVFENVTAIISLDKIKYVILHHQDPDFCSSVPLFEQKGANFKIVTHWRTQTLIKYYGIKSDYYIVNENKFRLVLQSGRELQFVQTPYLHFPGAIATYDKHSKILFSSDLFGAFSYNWSLYAGEDYIEGMKAFHEHYMPSNDILRPVMEVFFGMDISLIAPQHGSIIKENIKEHIKVLRELECGAFIQPIKKEIAKSGGYSLICSDILKRYASIYNKEEVLDAITELKLSFEDSTLNIIDYNYKGSVLWDTLFEQIYTKKGIQWIIIIEPLARKLSKEYDLNMPKIFDATLKKAEQKAIQLSEENIKLKEINDRLNKSIKETQEKLLKCPVTGLYNYEFFKKYLISEISELYNDGNEENPGIAIVSADNIEKIKFTYGDSEVNGVLKNIVYIINDVKDENSLIFRLEGAYFAVYLPNTTRENIEELAEKIRNDIAASEKFVEKITVSIGVVCMDELKEKNVYMEQPSEKMYDIATMRVRLAKSMGMNIVCSSSSVENYQEDVGKVLVVDTDEVNIDVVKTFLENLRYKVLTAKDGEEALKVTEKEDPDIIISEIMLPKLDGFLVREKLMMQSHTKNIPYIIVSYLKNDDSVKRAVGLDIVHYLKKPFMLSELLGVIKNKVKGEAYQ